MKINKNLGSNKSVAVSYFTQASNFFDRERQQTPSCGVLNLSELKHFSVLKNGNRDRRLEFEIFTYI